jgi:L-lactate dehydrogenase complex protein LldE
MTIHQSSPERVTLFIQCIVDGVYPEVAEAMVRIFDCLGIAVDYPTGQTCCGQPAFNSGYRTAARKAARHFIEVFEQAPTIVCPSGSCVAMVRHHYTELFTDDPAWRARAAAVAERTFELTEFLVDVLGVTDLGARYPGRATYHDSCHLLRTLGVRSQPRALLAKVRGLEFVEMVDSDRCCGFGGTFSVKYPEISTAMVAEKVANILATGADTVVGCDMACLMNIEGYLSRHNHPVKVKHIAQLLAP